MIGFWEFYHLQSIGAGIVCLFLLLMAPVVIQINAYQAIKRAERWNGLDKQEEIQLVMLAAVVGD